jgi:hypothetical protein
MISGARLAWRHHGPCRQALARGCRAGRRACSREHHHVDRPPTVPCAIGAPSRGQVPPARDGQEGQGLAGIRERAILAGGTAHAGSRPDGGWAVHAVLPIPGD